MSGYTNCDLEIEYYDIVHEDDLRASPIPTDHAKMATRHKNVLPSMTNSRNAEAAR